METGYLPEKRTHPGTMRFPEPPYFHGPLQPGVEAWYCPRCGTVKTGTQDSPILCDSCIRVLNMYGG